MEYIWIIFLILLSGVFFVFYYKKGKLKDEIEGFLENFLNNYDYLYIHTEIESAMKSGNFSHLNHQDIFTFCYLYTISNNIIPPHIGESQIQEYTKNILNTINKNTSLLNDLYKNYKKMITLLKSDPYFSNREIVKLEILPLERFKEILKDAISRLE